MSYLNRSLIFCYLLLASVTCFAQGVQFEQFFNRLSDTGIGIDDTITELILVPMNDAGFFSASEESKLKILVDYESDTGFYSLDTIPNIGFDQNFNIMVIGREIGVESMYYCLESYCQSEGGVIFDVVVGYPLHVLWNNIYAYMQDDELVVEWTPISEMPIQQYKIIGVFENHEQVISETQIGQIGEIFNGRLFTRLTQVLYPNCLIGLKVKADNWNGQSYYSPIISVDFLKCNDKSLIKHQNNRIELLSDADYFQIASNKGNQIVHETNVIKGTTYDLENYASGVYYVALMKNNKRTVKKIFIK